MGNWIKSKQGWIKAKQMQEYALVRDVVIDIKDSTGGIRVNNKILIAYKHSRWKILGELQWYPYFGITKLLDALYDDRLQEYAEEQQSKVTRTKHSAPVNPLSKEKELEIRKNQSLAYVYQKDVWQSN